MILNYRVLHNFAFIIRQFVLLEYFQLMFVISTQSYRYQFIDQKRGDTIFDPVCKGIYSRGLG